VYERVCVCFTHTLTHTTVRRGVVVGWDAQCCEADELINTHALTRTTMRRGVVVGWDAQCCEADELINTHTHTHTHTHNRAWGCCGRLGRSVL